MWEIREQGSKGTVLSVYKLQIEAAIACVHRTADNEQSNTDHKTDGYGAGKNTDKNGSQLLQFFHKLLCCGNIDGA